MTSEREVPDHLTVEMLDAGYHALCEMAIEPNEAEMRTAVRAIFTKMVAAAARQHAV
jgi:hypothetical protein